MSCVLWLFLNVPWVDVLCVIVVLPDHTRLLFSLRSALFAKIKPIFRDCNSNLKSLDMYIELILSQSWVYCMQLNGQIHKGSYR